MKALASRSKRVWAMDRRPRCRSLPRATPVRCARSPTAMHARQREAEPPSVRRSRRSCRRGSSRRRRRHRHHRAKDHALRPIRGWPYFRATWAIGVIPRSGSCGVARFRPGARWHGVIARHAHAQARSVRAHFFKLVYLTAARTNVACTVSHYGDGIEECLYEANLLIVRWCSFRP